MKNITRAELDKKIKEYDEKRLKDYDRIKVVLEKERREFDGLKKRKYTVMAVDLGRIQ